MNGLIDGWMDELGGITNGVLFATQVFGATGNLGPSICHAALEHGDYVTAVGRDIDGEKIVQGWHANCQGLVCDVRVRKTVQDVFTKAMERWGRVDVIVKLVFDSVF